MRARSGFTLVELLVALVLLEVGLLGVAGSVLLASRILARAEDREAAVGQAALLLDSLDRAAGPGSGTRVGPWGEIHWSAGSEGRVRVEVVPSGGRPWVLEDAALPPAGGAR